MALGSGAVRPIIVAPGETANGIAELFKEPNSPWLSFKTLWFSDPTYQGPWHVSGARIDGAGPIAFGERPEVSEILIPPFPTVNGTDGYREAPGGTFVQAPGCYAWQIDGVGFSYVIVVSAVAPG